MVDIAVMIAGADQTNLPVLPGSIHTESLKPGVFRETFVASVSGVEKKGAVSAEVSVPAPAGKNAMLRSALTQAGDGNMAIETSEVLPGAKSSSTDVRSAQLE